MKRNRKRSSAWFPWESLALLHCSFCQDNGCKRPSAGARTKDAEHRPLSHTNALCAVFIAWTGKHPTEQIFPSFCRCFGNTEKARATLLYSLFGESASIAFDWSRNARALPSATRRAEALHPLLTFFEKKVGLRTTTISYKNKTTVHRPESECAVVENTHPALITQEQWDIVQEVRRHKKRIPKQMAEPNIFSGLAYCADCGRTMVLHRASTMKKSDYNFKCYTYGKRGKGECTPHHIREEELYAIILDDLRRVTHFARKKERQFAEYINRKNTAQLRQEINALQMETDTARKRRSELATLFKRLYEDNVLGRVTNEQFRLLSADYNAEQKEIDDALPLKEERLEKLKSSAANVDAFIEKAKRYKTIDKLTPEIVRLFIARIEVGERTVKYSRHSAQKIRIVYRDIGEWDHDDAVEAEQQQPQVVAVTVAQPELLPA